MEPCGPAGVRRGDPAAFQTVSPITLGWGVRSVDEDLAHYAIGLVSLVRAW